MMVLSVVRVGQNVLRPQVSTLLLQKSRNSVSTGVQEITDVKPYQEIPGPKPYPIVGNTWRFLPLIGEFGNLDLNEWVAKIRKKYGKIVKISNLHGNADLLYLFDPKDVETMFRNEGQWPRRPGIKTIPYYRGILRDDFFKGTEGALFTEGKQWQDFRTKVNQTMMQPRNTKMYVGPIDDVTNDLVDKMRQWKNSNGELPSNFIDYLMRWALESITIIALDTRLGCLDPNLKPDSETQRMMDAMNYVFIAMYHLDVKPSLRHFTKRKEWKEVVKCFDFINEVALKYIRQAMDRIHNKVQNNDTDMSVLETLLIRNEDPMIATVMALDMMMAGIDTTSHSSAVAMHFLARNQDKQEKLYDELKRILPSKEQPITASDLEEMKYLKACIKESQRMCPITVGTTRETQKEMVVGNYLIPKGVQVMLPLRFISADEDNFPEADSFVPERWLKGTELHDMIKPFTFLPFGFGPRMCLGRRFAELEMQTFLAKVIRNFRIEYDQELKITPYLINMVSSPLNFKLEDRP